MFLPSWRNLIFGALAGAVIAVIAWIYGPIAAFAVAFTLGISFGGAAVFVLIGARHARTDYAVFCGSLALVQAISGLIAFLQQ